MAAASADVARRLATARAAPPATKAPPPEPGAAALLSSAERRAAVRFKDYLQRHAVQSITQLRRVLNDPMRRELLEDGRVLKLGELMVTEGLVSPSEVTRLLEAQRSQPNRKIGELIVEAGLLSEQALRHLLGQRLGMPAIDLTRFPIDPAAVLRLGPALCRAHRMLAVAAVDGSLVVALANPGDRLAIESARFGARMPVEFAVATAEEIGQMLDRYVEQRDDMEAVANAAESQSRAEGGEDDEPLLHDVSAGGDQRPIVRLVNGIINEAITRRASDVHIRPGARHVELLYRVDGVMSPVRNFKRSLLAAVVARVKIMARMDVTEKMLPQDGSTRVVHAGRVLDLRVSVMPTVNGESVAIRLLNTDNVLLSMDALGFQPEDLDVLRGSLTRSSGMVLVTGPTGSGKSTTLYAALKQVLKRNVKIMSVEEPVEYHLDGVEQISVNHDIGYSFGKALRHILRHDPDVIMVGEIRDRETAQIALEASLTGHLVLTTLHTNSAAAAIPRFLDMGVEPYVVASTLSAVIAQRLIRVNCTSCLQPEDVTEEMRTALGVGSKERFSRGVGCDRCNGTGYVGRQVVYELLKVDDAVRGAILAQASAEDLQRMAMERGLVPLTRQALDLARQRQTSLAEVYRVRLS